MPPEWLPQVRLPGVYEFYRSRPPALLLANRALGFQIYDDVFQGHRPARVLKEAKLDATFAVGVADQRIRLARASGARGLCQLHRSPLALTCPGGTEGQVHAAGPCPCH